MDWMTRLLLSMLWDDEGDGGGGGGDEGGEGGEAPPAAPAEPPPMFKPTPPAIPPTVDEAVEEEEETEEEEAEETDPELASLQQRDAEIVEMKRALNQQYRQLQPLIQAQQLLSQGKRKEGLKALGMDHRELLADEYGDELLPPAREVPHEERFEELATGQKTAKQEIAELKRDLAYSELSRDIRDELDQNSEGLEMMKMMAGKGKGVFYRGLIDRALNEADPGTLPNFKDVLHKAEEEYLVKWTNDAQAVLQIEKARKRLGVDFVKTGKKSKAKPTAAAQRVASPDAVSTSLLNDMGENPPPLGKPKGKLTREEGKARMVAILRQSREAQEAKENNDE